MGVEETVEDVDVLAALQTYSFSAEIESVNTYLRAARQHFANAAENMQIALYLSHEARRLASEIQRGYDKGAAVLAGIEKKKSVGCV